MPLRFPADHCVSTFIINTLKKAGHEVIRLKDHLPVESPDLTVISKTQELGAILLSLDGDFADIVAYPPSQFKGIIAFQVRNHPEITRLIMERLLHYLEDRPSMEHDSGKPLVVEAGRIRLRE